MAELRKSEAELYADQLLDLSSNFTILSENRFKVTINALEFMFKDFELVSMYDTIDLKQFQVENNKVVDNEFIDQSDDDEDGYDSFEIHDDGRYQTMDFKITDDTYFSARLDHVEYSEVYAILSYDISNYSRTEYSYTYENVLETRKKYLVVSIDNAKCLLLDYGDHYLLYSLDGVDCRFNGIEASFASGKGIKYLVDEIVDSRVEPIMFYKPSRTTKSARN